MDEIVEQTENIANAFVAFTVQLPTAFSSPPQGIVDHVNRFNLYAYPRVYILYIHLIYAGHSRLAEAKSSATRGMTTKRNIFVRLRDAQRTLEQLEAFWRAAQFAYNDLIVSEEWTKLEVPTDVFL
jgi:hypothetical protein